MSAPSACFVLTHKKSGTITIHNRSDLRGRFERQRSADRSRVAKTVWNQPFPAPGGISEFGKKELVDTIPRKGTFVKRVTRRDIAENFSVRASLAAQEAGQKG